MVPLREVGYLEIEIAPLSFVWISVHCSLCVLYHFLAGIDSYDVMAFPREFKAEPASSASNIENPETLAENIFVYEVVDFSKGQPCKIGPAPRRIFHCRPALEPPKVGHEIFGKPCQVT